MRIPCSSSAGRSSPLEAAVEAAVELEHARLDRVDLLARGEAVGAARVDPGVELVEEAGDPDHEELVEVGGVDRAEADPLQQRHLGVLGEFEHPLVEVEPGELAIEVESGIVDRPIVLRRPPADLRPPQAARDSRLPRPRRRRRGRAGSRRRAAPSSAPRSARGRARDGGARRAGGAAAARRRAAAARRRGGRRRGGRAGRCGGSRSAPPGRPRRRRRPAGRWRRPRGSPGRRCRCR